MTDEAVRFPQALRLTCRGHVWSADVVVDGAAVPPEMRHILYSFANSVVHQTGSVPDQLMPPPLLAQLPPAPAPTMQLRPLVIAVGISALVGAAGLTFWLTAC